MDNFNDGTHFISSDPFCHLVVTKLLREEAEVHDILKNVDFSLHITTHLVEERFTLLWPLVTFLLVLPRSRFHTYALPRRSRGWKWKKVASSTFSERMLQTHGLIVIWNYGIWTNLFERFDRRYWNSYFTKYLRVCCDSVCSLTPFFIKWR